MASNKINMEDSGPHPLKSLLQNQLATDSSAVLHLPFTLTSLTAAAFTPSPHLSKWTTRIGALLHAKDSASRWTGLCLAHKTALLSRDIMLENAMNWLSVSMPILSRNEPLPTLKASIRLISIIFTSATDMSEFQRQVSTPNIPKFTTALLDVAEKQSNLEFLGLIMDTLRRLVTTYPTAHKASQQAIASLTFRFLNGSAPTPIPYATKRVASSLYVSLHLVGGKVASPLQWRKSLDETLSLAWNAFRAVRTTFPSESTHLQRAAPNGADEHLNFTPLNLDKLQSCVVVLCDLLNASTQRAVQVPVDTFTKLVISLISTSADDKIDGWVDPTIRALETSIVPKLWALGCDLLITLSERLRTLLNPSLTRLVTHLVSQLEKQPDAGERVKFSTALYKLLDNAYHLASPVLVSRTLRMMLIPLARLLTAAKGDNSTTIRGSVSSSKKGKKRVRNYEGGEILRESKDYLFLTAEEQDDVLAIIKSIALLASNPYLDTATQSLTSRVVLAVLLTLPQMPPSLISPSTGFYEKLILSIQQTATRLASGTTGTMSQSLPLVINASFIDRDTLHDLEILIHPRAPPIIRTMPYLESLSLFPSEESNEEKDARRLLGLGQSDPIPEPAPVQASTPSPLAQPSKSTNIPTPLVAPQQSQPRTIVPAPFTPLVPPATASVPASSPIVAEKAPSPSISATPIIPAQGNKQTPSLSNNPLPPPSVPLQMLIDDEDEDEEMPAINIDSDSD